MRKFFFVLGFMAVIVACRPGIDREMLKNDLLNVDREFSSLSVQSGTRGAFLQYMADEMVIYPQKGRPIRGKAEYQSLTRPDGDTASDAQLQWKPFFAEISQSGDLGYTLGSYQLTIVNDEGESNVRHGYYCTIWKKQPDGTWKFVFDGGNEGPPPEDVP